MPLPDMPPARSGRALIPSGPGARNRRFVLRHSVFSSFGLSFFRMSEVEHSPVLVIPMDDQEAVLPLHGLMREFRIASTDDDGVMLGMVGPSLEFVTGLRVGDWLPPEILTGEASWTAALAGGVSLAAVAAGIANGAEAQRYLAQPIEGYHFVV